MLKLSDDSRWIPTLYFAEGIPYAIVNTVAVILYKRLGIDNTTIAFFTSWLYFPWVIKALWSPFVGIISTRRRWIITMQILISLSFAAIGLFLPGSLFFRTTLSVFWCMAFFSATHDIAADGFYMLVLTPHKQSLWVGLRSSFYRLAMVTGQGCLVIVAGYLEQRMPVAEAWSFTFIGVSILFGALTIWHAAVLPVPLSDKPLKGVNRTNILHEFADTFISFFRKPGIAGAVTFMILYKIPEALLTKLIAPFLLDSKSSGGLDLSTSEVGMVYGTLGVAALLAGGITGGFAAAKGGLKKWLYPMAWSMSVTCLSFLLLSLLSDTPLWIVTLSVAIEQFGYGFGATAYTLYLLFYSDGERSTSYYAICTGIMALGMMLPGMTAGMLQSNLGYTGFFILTIALCPLTILSCRLIKIPETYGQKKK